MNNLKNNQNLVQDSIQDPRQCFTGATRRAICFFFFFKEKEKEKRVKHVLGDGPYNHQWEEIIEWG